MARRILVPLDGSSLAEQALAWAVTLGQALPAELLLLRAVLVPPDAEEMLARAGAEAGELYQEFQAESERYLAGLVEQLQAVGVSVVHRVERGSPAATIVDSAAQADAQFIVMATHGYSGLKRWTHGSVAERVLQTADVPLLLVRAQAEEVAPAWPDPVPCRRILVPLDGSAVAEQVLPTASMLAQALDAELVLFQVPIVYVSGWMTGDWYLPVQGILDSAEQDAHTYLDGVASDLAAQGIRATTDTMIGSVANCIIDRAEADDIHLVAMCTHGRTGLARWALGSVADRVLRGGSTPVWLVRAT